MKGSLLAATLVVLALSPAATAQQATNPIRYTWIVSSCENWNCAASALILANGEPSVIVLPTTIEETPWLVLRRVEEGSVYIPETESFGCEVFEQVGAAATMAATMEVCRQPVVLTVPDGRNLVIARKQCSGVKRRAVR